jgi:hypothetical protein
VQDTTRRWEKLHDGGLIVEEGSLGRTRKRDATRDCEFRGCELNDVRLVQEAELITSASACRYARRVNMTSSDDSFCRKILRLKTNLILRFLRAN